MSKPTDQLLVDLERFNPEEPDAGWMAAKRLAIADNEGNPAVISALIKVVNGENKLDAAARSQAAETLGILAKGKPGVVECLTNAVKNDAYLLTRAYSARALGNLGTPAAVKDLLDVVKDEKEDKRVWAEAIEALCKLSGQVDRKPLIEVLTTVNERKKGKGSTSIDIRLIRQAQLSLKAVREFATVELGKIDEEIAKRKKDKIDYSDLQADKKKLRESLGSIVQLATSFTSGSQQEGQP